MSSSSEKSNYELQREQNILEIRKKLGFNYNPNAIATELVSDDDDDDDIPIARRISHKRKKDVDETYKARVNIYPEKEQRRSLRIAKIEPINDGRELEDEDSLSDKDPNEDLEGYVKDLQKVIRPSKKRSIRSLDYSTIDGYRVKEFSQNEINNIAKVFSHKKRSRDSGTTCHQCRQCTTDTKSFCRNVQCIGINGQLCGPCLNGRYGEDLESTLKDPKWTCPYCRRICNCSICRRREGRLPTGSLVHVANKKGFTSVHHLLNLNKTDTNDDDSENNEFSLDDKSDNEDQNDTNDDEAENNSFESNTKSDVVYTNPTNDDETENNGSKSDKESDVNKNDTNNEAGNNGFQLNDVIDDAYKNDTIDDEADEYEFKLKRDSADVNKNDTSDSKADHNGFNLNKEIEDAYENDTNDDEAENNGFKSNKESDVISENDTNDEVENNEFKLNKETDDEHTIDLNNKNIVSEIDGDYILEERNVVLSQKQETHLQKEDVDNSTRQEDKENVTVFSFLENEGKFGGKMINVLKSRDERQNIVETIYNEKKGNITPTMDQKLIAVSNEVSKEGEYYLLGFDADFNPIMKRI